MATFFGISNLNYLKNPFVNDLNLFPNISEETLLNNIKINKNYDISINNEEKVRLDNYYYDPIPILYQHKNNGMLKDIWDNINHGDIVTNRASKRSLTYNDKKVNVEKKWIDFDVDEHDKMIYLISKKCDPEENVPDNKLQIGFHAPTVVFENVSNQLYTVYRYIRNYNKTLQCFEHYTCEIDGFVKSEMDNEIIYTPVEFKTLKSSENQMLDINTLWNRVKVSIAIQCKLSDVNNVIFGFRDNTSMKLKYYDIPTIIKGIEYQVEEALERMEKYTIDIIQHCKQSQFLSIDDQQQL